MDHPHETGCRDGYRPRNIRKAADKMAIRVGRAWPDGTVWRLRNDEMRIGDIAAKGIVQTLGGSTPHARQIHRIFPSLNGSAGESSLGLEAQREAVLAHLSWQLVAELIPLLPRTLVALHTGYIDSVVPTYGCSAV